MTWLRSTLGAGRLLWHLAAAVGGLYGDAVARCVVRRASRLLQLVDDAHDVEDDECTAGTCGHRWESSTVDGGDNVHIIPLRDQVNHAEDEDCVCGPTTHAVFRPSGSNGWLHVHHSLDNREAIE